LIARAAMLALAIALGVPAARAAGDGVDVRATLHSRVTALGDVPGRDVLYDPASRAFALDGYLVPSQDERYASSFASLSADGRAREGDLRWRIAVDTGELRRRAFPLAAAVCASAGGTGLGPCTFQRDGVLLEQTVRGDAQLTSNGRPFRDELDATLFVREAYAALSLGRAGFATVRAGRKRTTVGGGFVYDDYATGAEVALDLGAIGPPLALSASLFQPTRDLPREVDGLSPMVALRLDWLRSLFESAGVFVAAHRDRTGSVAELFRGALVEQRVAVLAQATPDTDAYRAANRRLAALLALPLESDATLAWAGTSGRLTPLRGQRVAWTAAVLGGRIDRVAVPDATTPAIEDVSVRGRLLSAEWETSLGRHVGVGASLLYLSGGTFPGLGERGGEYHGFLGVAPFVTATNLFFGGGLSESFAARQSTAPGVNGRGVAAPGVSLAVDATRTLGLDVKAAYLLAPVAGPFGGRVYGVELDGVLSWSPWEWLVLGAEVDVLWPGDFFAGDRTIYKTVLAVDLVTP
jgi:hypothetical protein